MGAFQNPFWQGVQMTTALREAARQDQELQLRKQQMAAEQEYRHADMDLRRDASNRADVQTRASLLENGRPAGEGSTMLQNVQTPPVPLNLPGNDAQIPGQQMNTGIPVDPNRIIEFKKTRAYMPTEDERAQSDLGQKVNLARALADATSMPVPESMSDRIPGIPRGMRVSREQMGHLFTLLNDSNAQASPAPEKKAGLQFHPVQNDNGDVTAFTFDPSSGAVKQGAVFKGVGKRKEQDGGGGKSADSGAVKVNAAQLRMVTEKKMSGLRKAEADYQQAARDPLSDPEEARRNLASAKQSVQDEYEQTLQGWGLPVEHFSYADQRQPQQQPQQQQPAKAVDKTAAKVDKTAAAKQAKPATLDNVRAYAKAKGVTEAQAIREFQQYGYQVK